MEDARETAEGTREIGAELVLQRRERGRGGRGCLLELSRERGRFVPQRHDLVTIMAGRRLVGCEIEAFPERPHRRTQSGKSDTPAQAVPDGLDDRRDLGEDSSLPLLSRG